jgi:hypothetical protein
MTSNSGPVAYLTDVEGMWSRVESFLAGNPLVSLDSQGRLQLAPNAVFVFGGDAIDRGPDGRRIVATLLEAKRRLPNQVVLLAGNRDINKMRLRRELSGFPLAKVPVEVYSQLPALLRWIFKNTMGAGDAFAMRKAELERTNGVDISDIEVVESYQRDLASNGAMTLYLTACQLAYRHGETLFVHGAVTEESLGTVPDQKRADPAAHVDLDAWIEALNAWYRAQVQAYVEQRFGDDGSPLWKELIAYQAPLPDTKLNQASVVYGRLTDDLGNPHLPAERVIDELKRVGVVRLVVGHTPAGDVPSVLRDRDFELVMADNSHARVNGGTQLLIEPKGLSVSGETVLDDGSKVAMRYTLARDAAMPIGLYDGDSGHLVKGPLEGGRFALAKGLPEYRIEQIAVSEEQLAARRLVKPKQGEVAASKPAATSPAPSPAAAGPDQKSSPR